MRILLFYDLPFDNKSDTHQYTKFRNNILKLGYTQIQYSVYSRVIQTKTMVEQHITKIKNILPLNGSVRAIVLTEKQYNSMYILRGEILDNEIVNDCKRYRKV